MSRIEAALTHMTHDPREPDATDTTNALVAGPAIVRRRLPNRRFCETLKFRFGGFKFFVSVGRFADGSPAEIFINVGKTGSELERSTRDSAVLASIGLQHGIPLETLRRALSRTTDGKRDSALCWVLDRLAAEAAE